MTSTGVVSGTAHAALITAPGSGSGKSIVTAALARLHRNAGWTVRVCKHGPDYLDPMVLEVASGAPVYQLHPWMTGDDECRWRLASAAAAADVVLVEGSMGLFDGNQSSADLAVLAGLPAIPVIDAAGMAQTFGAVANGLASHRDDLALTQVIANRVGSVGHGRLLDESMPDGLELLGAIPRDDAMAIPDRHLGLVQASELDGLDAQLDRAAAVLTEAGLDQLPAAVTIDGPPPKPVEPLLANTTVAIARDEAFGFIYRANVELLDAMGARVVEFSMLHDDALPTCDAVWLPGGYPELHAAKLAANTSMLASFAPHLADGGRVLAECGGLMACMQRLVDADGQAHELLGLLEGEVVMQSRLQGLGMHALDTDEGQLRGHTFHHASLHTDVEPWTTTTRMSGSTGEGVFRRDGLTATFFHGYFPSAPELVGSLLRRH